MFHFIFCSGQLVQRYAFPLWLAYFSFVLKFLIFSTGFILIPFFFLENWGHFHRISPFFFSTVCSALCFFRCDWFRFSFVLEFLIFSTEFYFSRLSFLKIVLNFIEFRCLYLSNNSNQFQSTSRFGGILGNGLGYDYVALKIR